MKVYVYLFGAAALLQASAGFLNRKKWEAQLWKASWVGYGLALLSLFGNF